MRPVIYQLFVRHFSNFQRGGVPNGTREQNGCGTFAGVNEAALEALAQMGITHLWLTGILRHATQTAYPGLPAHPACVVKGIAGSPYAITDYFDVDPDLATEPERRMEEFRALVERVRRCGMVPMLDFVPNHVSRCYGSPKQNIDDLRFTIDDSLYRRPKGMYDVRSTMYDLLVRARCAGVAERERSRISEATGGFSREGTAPAPDADASSGFSTIRRDGTISRGDSAEAESGKDAGRGDSCGRESDTFMRRKACGDRMTKGFAAFSENFSDSIQEKRDVFFARDNAFYYLDPPADGDRRMMLPNGEFEAERGCGRVTGNNAATWHPSVFDWYETVKLNYGCDYRYGAAAAESLPGMLAAPDAVPRTWRMMDRVLAWWQGMGVGGFRCDMAHMVPLPFWRWEIARARLRDEAAFFMAEAYDDPMKLTPGDPLQGLLSAGFDAVYDAAPYQALRKLYEGGAWANDLDAFHRPEHPLFHGGVRYVENHDEPRLASPLFWGGHGASVARAVMTAQYATTCGPVLFYNGQEVLERAEGPTGFGGDNGRTSIFDYTNLPRLQRWACAGEYNGKELDDDEKELRRFCASLLRLLQHPALADGSFYGLNWANRATPHYGRAPQETTSGHLLYAFLRHNPQARRTLLVVCNFAPDSVAETTIHIPRNACAWAGKTGPRCMFSDLLDPTADAILTSPEVLDASGLPIRVPTGKTRVLEWTCGLV